MLYIYLILVSCEEGKRADLDFFTEVEPMATRLNGHFDDFNLLGFEDVGPNELPDCNS